MRKQILLIAIFLCWVTTAHAGFDWGRGTYESYDDILIINSLGDQVTPSTFGNLGVNDFIPENGVKNYLALEGYTQAIDYNPSVTNSQFVDYYNDKPGDGYTKLTFAGLYGDPRQTQDVYVLTSEYDRLSAQGQASRMDGIDVVNATQTADIASNASRIEVVNSESISRDDDLQGNIDDEATTRATADKKETKARIAGDKTLQKNIDREADTRAAADTTLQDNINTEASTRADADTQLNNNINNVSMQQTAWNQNQDVTLANHDQRINNNTNRINDLDKRVGKLEDTQGIIGAEVRVYDGKKWQVTTFVDYSGTRNVVDRAGIRFQYKLGSSYEERRLNDLEQKLNKLMAVTDQPVVKDKAEMYTTDNGLGIRGKF